MASFYFSLIFILSMSIAQSLASSSSLILPLKTQKIPSMFLPKPPNKLRFHHNVTLTVTLAVGSPPQNVTMVLDTGSELSWLPCSNTSSPTPVAARPSSPSNNYYYNPRSSSSYSPIPCSSPTCQSQARDLPIPATCDAATKSCHVSLSYADASSSEGSLAADNFLIGSSPPLKTVFGCMGSTYSSASSSDPVTAGLLGMNRGSLSFVTQTATRRFSYCISDRDESGLLLIGEADPNFVVPLNYTPLIQISLPLPYFDRVAYSVQLEGIRVGDVLLPIPKSVLEPDHTGAGQTMVDSGTQFTFLLGSAYDLLKAEFLKQAKGVLVRYEDDPDFVFQGAFDTCFKMGDGVDVDQQPVRLPEVTMVFSRGAEVRVGGGRLLYRAGEGIRCLTFGNAEMMGVEAYVIGHHHQVNVWVEYDLENGRVGFGQVQCDWASQKLGLLL